LLQGEAGSDREFLFKVFHASTAMREWVFAAETAEQRERWINVMSHACRAEVTPAVGVVGGKASDQTDKPIPPARPRRPSAGGGEAAAVVDLAGPDAREEGNHRKSREELEEYEEEEEEKAPSDAEGETEEEMIGEEAGTGNSEA